MGAGASQAGVISAGIQRALALPDVSDLITLVHSSNAVDAGSGDADSCVDRVGGDPYTQASASLRPTISGLLLTFDGTDRLEKSGDASSFYASSTHTVFARAKPVGAFANMCLWAAAGAPGTSHVSLHMGTNGLRYQRVDDFGATNNVTHTVALSTSNWYSIAVKFTGANVRFYLDGTFLAQYAAVGGAIGSSINKFVWGYQATGVNNTSGMAGACSGVISDADVVDLHDFGAADFS